jgi:hypothetical protein
MCLGLLAMRWLLIGLLVSLGALLYAAAALARHIWLQRANFGFKPPAGAAPPPNPAREADTETES